MTDEQRFESGDVIAFRDSVYEVKQADITPDGRILQYRLEAREGPPATLIPNGNGEPYTVKEYHEVHGEDITVIQ
jgi:hypothetical protein